MAYSKIVKQQAANLSTIILTNKYIKYTSYN